MPVPGAPVLQLEGFAEDMLRRGPPALLGMIQAQAPPAAAAGPAARGSGLLVDIAETA